MDSMGNAYACAVYGQCMYSVGVMHGQCGGIAWTVWE